MNNKHNIIINKEINKQMYMRCIICVISSVFKVWTYIQCGDVGVVLSVDGQQ